MTKVPLALPPESIHGAHRVHFHGAGDGATWTRALQLLEVKLEDMAAVSGWEPRARIDVVASEPTAAGAVAYLVGSLELWRSMELAGLANPVLAAMERELASTGGRLDRVVCESRAIDTDYYARVSSGAWPWPVQSSAPLVDVVRPVGEVSASQMRALAKLMTAALRERADLHDPRASIEGDRVRLSAEVRTGRLVELAYLWWQVCWVQLDALQLGSVPAAAIEGDRTAADELRELVRSPVADRALLPKLEGLLSDHTPARVSIPDVYADVAFLAAQALAATRTACRIDEPVVARGVAYPLDTAAVAVLCTLSGLDPRGTPALDVVRVLMSRGLWPLADLEIPGELRPRDPARLAALVPPAPPVALPPVTLRRIDDREVRDRIEALAAGDAAARRDALPLPLAEASASAEMRAAIEACLDDRSITLVDWFGTPPSGRGPWLGELGWAAAWSLAWERRVAGISDPVIVEDVLVPVARAEAERIARTGPNASLAFLIDAIGRERANLPRRQLVIRPDEPFRPDEVGVTRLRTAIAADDSARIEVLLDSIAGGHWDDPRYEPLLVSLVDRGGALGSAASAALDGLRAVLHPTPS